tara:strand:+ start:80 stop:208 length:129 start_codon:yes stop_codon:yes gene_type:complete
MKDKKAAKKIIKNKSLWTEAEILYAKTFLYLTKREKLDKKDK